jgi:hypothetical protein
VQGFEAREGKNLALKKSTTIVKYQKVKVNGLFQQALIISSVYIFIIDYN